MRSPHSNSFRVYELIDPRTDEIKYVGVTGLDLLDRLVDHIREEMNLRKRGWIRELLSESRSPTIREVSYHTDRNLALIHEKRLIEAYLESGIDLLNSHGASLETRKRMSEAAKRRPHRSIPHTPESRKRISEAKRGQKYRPRSEEHRKKLSESTRKSWEKRSGEGSSSQEAAS